VDITDDDRSIESTPQPALLDEWSGRQYAVHLFVALEIQFSTAWSTSQRHRLVVQRSFEGTPIRCYRVDCGPIRSIDSSHHSVRCFLPANNTIILKIYL